MTTTRTLALITFAIAGSLYLGTRSTLAQCGPLNEYLEVNADNPLTRAHFGSAMAISGATVLVAAYTDPELGHAAGAVFVFDISDPNLPVQRFKLFANDGDDYDNFGWSVALHNNLGIIGAEWDDVIDEHSGSAYIFDVATGEQLIKLVPSDGAYHNEFGHSVAINETIAAAGSPLDSSIAQWAGSVHLFDSQTGEQIAKVVPHDPGVGAHFGASIALQGHTLIVGAERDEQAALDCGAVYVFDVSDPLNPVERFKRMPNDASDFQLFGESVTLDGDITVIGSKWDDDRGTHSGSAYFFDITNGAQLSKVIPDRFSAQHNLGSSVAVSGNLAVVGAQSPYDVGYAYVYDITDPSHPTRHAHLEGSTSQVYEEFGSSVGITGHTALVGAMNHERGVGAGGAYCFSIACGPTLAVAGSCPGPINFNVSDATPNGNVAFLYARSSGSVIIPQGNPCAGTQIGLGATVVLAASRRADEGGNATLSANVPPAACGNVFVQALDLSDCSPSNLVAVE